MDVMMNIQVNNYKPPNYVWNRLKHRMNDTDLKTIVSNQNIQQLSSQLNLGSECQYVIEQSLIQTPNIVNNFRELNEKRTYDGYSQMLAIQKNNNVVVSLKIIPSHEADKISRQLSNYCQIPDHSCILGFYQHSMNENDHILIKQPYTSRIRSVIDRVDITIVLCDIESGLVHLQRNGKFADWVQVDDIVQVYGVFKLTNLSRVWCHKKITISQNIARLKTELTTLKSRNY